MHTRRKVQVEKKTKKLKATRNGPLYMTMILILKFCSTKVHSYQARKYSKITPLPTMYMLPLINRGYILQYFE